jgi:hypothetical protein
MTFVTFRRPFDLGQMRSIRPFAAALVRRAKSASLWPAHKSIRNTLLKVSRAILFRTFLFAGHAEHNLAHVVKVAHQANQSSLIASNSEFGHGCILSLPHQLQRAHAVDITFIHPPAQPDMINIHD